MHTQMNTLTLWQRAMAAFSGRIEKHVIDHFNAHLVAATKALQDSIPPWESAVQADVFNVALSKTIVGGKGNRLIAAHNFAKISSMRWACRVTLWASCRT